jgi:hypothetical protein
VKVLWAGIWARRGLNGAGLAVTVVALLAAVVGPIYARSSAEHLLDVRLSERAPYTTGLTLTEQPVNDPGFAQKVKKDGTVVPEPRATILAAARAGLTHIDAHGLYQPVRLWLYDDGGVLRFHTTRFSVPLYWRDGMCKLAQVRGTCPTGPNDVLMQQTMAKTMGVGAGDTVTLTFPLRKYKRVHLYGSYLRQEFDTPYPRKLHIVGTYTIPHPMSPGWFDLGRFSGTENLRPVPPSALSNGGNLPKAPALLVGKAAMTSQSWIGGGDRAIDPTAVNLDTMAQARQIAKSFEQFVIDRTGRDPLPDLDLDSVLQEVRSEHTLLSRVMTAALAPLVVLALLLLYALISAAADVRRPHVALAKLRGHRRGQVFWFAVAEPFAMVLVAVPVSVLAGIGLARLIARIRLSPGTPVAFDRVAVATTAVVVAAALLAAAAAAMSVIREPLSTSLSGGLRARVGSRVRSGLRIAVVAVAVAAVAQLLTSKHQSGQLLALITPLLVALAIAVGGLVLLRLVSGLLVRRTASAGKTAGYLATRRLGRRADLFNLMVPMLLAVSVIAFAASAEHASDAWRFSRASAEVGAGRTFDANVPPGRLLAVTRKVDPQGKYVAAAVFDNRGDGAEKHVLVDTSRLAAVTSWDPSWSRQSVRSLQRALQPRWHRPTFHGRFLTVKASDIHLRASFADTTELWFRYVNDRGVVSNQEVGTLRPGHPNTLRLQLFDCHHSCQVGQFTFTGSGQSVSDVDGSLVIDSVAVDGEPVHWGLFQPGGWRPARPFPVSLIDPPVTLHPTSAGLGVHLYLGHLPPGTANPTMVSGVASITPAVVPDAVPAIVTRGTPVHAVPRAGSGVAQSLPGGVGVGTALSGDDVPIKVVGRVAALPELGNTGELADLASELVEFNPPPGAVVNTQLWVARGAPASVVRAVKAHGVVLTPIASFRQTLRDLHEDAFARGLQVFLGVGIATLLLAIFGMFAFAVMSSRWRSYEVASLRVVGVSQRTLVRASLVEHLTMLGLAVLLGVGSAIVSLTLVLPAISLGPPDPVDPAPTYAIAWPLVLGSGAVVLVLAVLIAVVVSRRVTRLGRPATLRWAEQG